MDRTKLAAIASLVAAISVGGIATQVWQSNPGTQLVELADAGVGGCPTRLVTCNWRVDQDGRNILEDAGVVVGTGYRTLSTRVAVCAALNGDPRAVVLPPMPGRGGIAALASPDLGSCTVAADPGGALWRTAQSACVRRPLGGTLAGCHIADGGDQGELNAYPRAYLAGAQCEDTACTVFAGETP